MTYLPPDKKELREALNHSYIKNENKEYSDVKGWTFYENVSYLVDGTLKQKTNFMNIIRNNFPNKFLRHTNDSLKMYTSNFLTETELTGLCDLMYKLYNDKIAYFVSNERYYSQHKYVKSTQES